MIKRKSLMQVAHNQYEIPKSQVEVYNDIGSVNLSSAQTMNKC